MLAGEIPEGFLGEEGALGSPSAILASVYPSLNPFMDVLVVRSRQEDMASEQRGAGVGPGAEPGSEAQGESPVEATAARMNG